MSEPLDLEYTPLSHVAGKCGWPTFECEYLQNSWPDDMMGAAKAAIRADLARRIEEQVRNEPLFPGADGGITLRPSEVDRMTDYRERLLGLIREEAAK